MRDERRARLQRRVRGNSLLNNCYRRYYRFREDRLRRKPPQHVGIAAYKLNEHQVYPYGSNFEAALARSAREEYASIAFDRNTVVSSLGSCFAEHFARHMLEVGFNYLVKEENSWASSANWGRVFTVPNMSQIVDYSIDSEFPTVLEYTGCRSWKQKEQGWFDPLRDGSPTHVDPDTARHEVASHRVASHEVLKSAQILVITLGQNEAWRDMDSGLVWANRPPQDIIDANDKRFSVERFEQSYVQDLMRSTLRKLFDLNPRLQVILTISPVPAAATFVEKSVIAEAWANKALLRVVAEDIVQEFAGSVSYFPSFEMVLAYNPYSFRADNRHVMPDVVDRILHVFDMALGVRAK